MITNALISGISWLFGTETAYAQVSNIITGLAGENGGAAAVDIINTIHTAGRSLVVVVSVLMLIRAAAKMVGSTSEDKMEEGRRSVTTTVSGIILINLTYAFVAAFWGGGDQNIVAGANDVNEQIIGLIRWAQVLVGILAVAMIVVSAFKVMASFGKEDAGEEMKRAVFGVIVGVFLIAFDTVIVESLGGGGPGSNATPEPLITIVMNSVRNLMMYLALLAVVMIIYAGIMMIVNIGSDEQYEKSKGLIVRVLIGLTIILFSYFIVDFILGAIL